MYGSTFDVSETAISVRPWKAPLNAITPGRPVASRAIFTAFSTASAPELKKAARAGAAERRDREQALGELDVHLVRDDREVGVREARRLLRDRGDDLRVRVADVQHADAAGEVDERVAVDVGEQRALRLGGHDRQVDGERRGDDALEARHDLLRARAGDLGADVDGAGGRHGAPEGSEAVGFAVLEHELDPDPLAPVRPLVRGGARGRRALPGDDDARDGVRGRPPVGADGAAEGRRRARLRLLHEPRLAQGPRAGGESARRARPLLAGARSAGAGRGAGRGGRLRRVGGLLGDAAARESTLRLGLAAERGREGSRAELEASVAEIATDFGDDPPLPPFWGGYRVVPEAIELWEHRDDRLHDRVLYTRDGERWRLERLAP